ncbi:hypothetical protein DPMN_175532 [Dreissena polymorpha]|uniref:Protein quiver n=1 Tax=Dreissena polymorpha TaxID=45954 RepID=A0A9D4E6S6_DREPO|nr:hypothetical protein DPMN_175532 [Dreissena polymorpha]
MQLCAAIVFLVCCAGFCGAIRCYSCVSTTDSNCADEFSPVGITLESNCDYCSKSKGKIGSVQYVVRKCESNYYGSSECHSVSVSGMDVNVCSCNTDLCNSGPRVAASFAIGVIPIYLFLRSL